MNIRLSRLAATLFGTVAATLLVSAGGTLATIALGTVPAALAQDQAPAAQGQPQNGPAAGGHHMRMGKLLMSLNLSDAQKTQIRAIMADARKQNEGVTDRTARRANYQEALKKVQAVLTPAQRTELQTKIQAAQGQSGASSH